MSVEGSPAGDLADIDTEMKTSTSAALATGGGREDLHIHVGGGMRNQIFDFKAEMEVIICKEEGWKEIICELPKGPVSAALDVSDPGAEHELVSLLLSRTHINV